MKARGHMDEANLDDKIQNYKNVSFNYDRGSEIGESIKKVIVGNLNGLNDCIKVKTCLGDSGERFYAESMDPIFVKVANTLEHIDFISDEDPAILESVNDSVLTEMMSFENPAVFFLASVLLYKKGVSSILTTGDVAKNLESDLVEKYLVNLSKSNLIKNEKVRKLRNDVINSYLQTNNVVKLSYAVKSFKNISFKVSEVEKIKELYCELDIQDETEPQKILKYKFATFLNKYHVNEGC
jgi:hypothetical protein